MFKKIKQNLFRNSVRFRKLNDKLDTSMGVVQRDINFIKTFLIKKNQDDLNTLFDVVYETNMWEFGSGVGSLESATRGYVAFLQEFFKSHNIKSIADVGCGDWQFSKNLNFNIESNALNTGGGGNSPAKINYTGYDVSSYVIKNNKRLYESENVKFVHYNGDFNEIKPADLLICKDVLQHLPIAKIKEFISILPKFKYALIANDISEVPGLILNGEILPTEFRPIDLRLAPFNQPLELVYTIKRMPEYPDIAVMLYENKEK